MLDYNITIAELKKIVPPYGRLNVIFTDEEGKKRKTRVAWHDTDTLMYMYRGSKRHGWYLDRNFIESFVSYRPLPKNKIPEEVKWRKSWEKVAKYLEASGLWEDYLKDVNNALAIGMEKIKQAYTQYWVHHENLPYGESDKVNAEAIQKIDERLINYREDGTIYADTSIIWYMHYPAKIKSMYFGKYEHEFRKVELKRAMENKTSITVFGRSSYDVHCEYNAEKKMAWYSEEYKNCGNGHYYLALDDTHALFYEDD